MSNTYQRPNAEQRKKQMLSLWAEDPTLKERMRFVAKADGRPMNNFFNHEIAPQIEAVLAEKSKAMPPAKRKQYEALLKK